MNRQDLADRLIKKASQNDAFRSKLINEAKVVIEEETGIKIPDDISLKVLEEKPNEYYLVLPNSTKTEGELSEAELDTVSGGYSNFTDECTCWCG